MSATGKRPFELVVVSGKGGTGKTSIAASIATLAKASVMADCDVDASNLELLFSPTLRTREAFTGGMQAVINGDLCAGCGKCESLCRFEAIHPIMETGRRVFAVKAADCEGCGVCAAYCPKQAVELKPVKGGEWFLSDTSYGPLVHARLQPGLGNSGKLTTLVRNQARKIANETGRRFLLIDGPPGVGCPAIASLSGATRVLAVTEPTPSGAHDLERILELARHFQIPAWVCVNKFDLNEEATMQIERRAVELGAEIVERIPYDKSVTEAQRQLRPVVEHEDSPAARAIVRLWDTISKTIPPYCLLT